MPIELEEGIPTCNYCTEVTNDHGPPQLVTNGCKECNYTGRKNLWIIHGEKKGGHYHFRIWVGPRNSPGLICNGIMSEEDWKDLCLQMKNNPAWIIKEIG
jgi:hypothetical protein